MDIVTKCALATILVCGVLGASRAALADSPDEALQRMQLAETDVRDAKLEADKKPPREVKKAKKEKKHPEKSQ